LGANLLAVANAVEILSVPDAVLESQGIGLAIDCFVDVARPAARYEKAERIDFMLHNLV